MRARWERCRKTISNETEVLSTMTIISLRAFHDACEVGCFPVVKKFVEQARYPIDAVSEEGWTGLIMACFNQNNDVAKYLVENGANVNAANQNGTTVFMYAKTPVQKKPQETELLSYLLAHGADINALDNRHWTVLDYVIENNADELACWLVEQGATRNSLPDEIAE